MPTTSTLVDTSHLARGHIDTIQVLLNRAVGIGADDNGLTLGIKAQQVHDHPFALGELLYQAAASVI